MKLTNLELTSELRIVQPVGIEDAQVVDIRFALDGQRATIQPDFYNAVFYQLMNGFVVGSDGTGFITGVKCVAYDNVGTVIGETEPTKLDRVLTEGGTELSCITTVTLPDSSTASYIHRVDVVYVANDNDVETEMTIFSTTSPQYTSFAEDIPSTTPVKRGVEIGANMTTKLDCSFRMYWAN
jgi:hypothetical protein